MPTKTQPEKTTTIILTGGGSGGHITPLLSLAHELKAINSRCQVIYVGLKGEKVEGLQSRYEVFDQVCLVPAGKFRRYHGQSYLANLVDVKTLVLNIRDFFRVIRGIFTARRLLKRLRPDVVFSKGSYVAVPVGIAAHQLNVPIVTHDSDTHPGLANRIIGRWASVHAYGMPAAGSTYPKDSVKIVGIPLSRHIEPVSKTQAADYKQALGLAKNSQLLLVSGGGLGARDINHKLAAIVPNLLNVIPELQIIHITGKDHETNVATSYAKSLSAKQLHRVKTIGFTDEFYRYSAAADLIITRAGATSLAEFALQGKACIVIPSPFLSGGHQLKNAQMLQKSRAIEVINNDDRAELLQQKVVELFSDDIHRQALADNLSAYAKPHASKDLAKLIMDAAKHPDQEVV